ncbi:NAD(P)-dependent oxidoreductase [Aquipuribacter nitratireducens]|uniref:NAD(P)-dependent oxidoreductase n=1 Tax=Aquipuribacter nitratireducens TaxID=650104 RepID=A0ABW0GNZ5_9MICO
MRIAVTGATGRTGVHVVRALRGSDHEVVAVVRDEAKARDVLADAVAAGGVEVRTADVTDAASLTRAVAGCDGVVSALGPVKGSPPDLMTRAASAALDAVRALPRRRLVWLTGAGVRRPGDTPGVADRLIVTIMSVVASRTLQDSREAVTRVVAAGDVDWTVVRAPRLTDGPPAGRRRVADRVGGGHGTTLPRADLGPYLAGLVVSDGQLRAAPVVSA